MSLFAYHEREKRERERGEVLFKALSLVPQGLYPPRWSREVTGSLGGLFDDEIGMLSVLKF